MGRGDPRGKRARGWIRGAERGGGDGKEGVLCEGGGGRATARGGGAPARCRGRRGEVRLGGAGEEGAERGWGSVTGWTGGAVWGLTGRTGSAGGSGSGSLGFVCFCGGTGCEWGRALLGFVPWPTAIACTLTCS